MNSNIVFRDFVVFFERNRGGFEEEGCVLSCSLILGMAVFFRAPLLDSGQG